MHGSSRSGSGYRRWSVRLAAVLLAVASLVSLPFIRTYWNRSAWVGSRGCTDGPTAAGVNPTTYPGSFTYPYGAVRSCRVLARQPHLFGRTEASVVLRLDTDAGLVLVRVDYRDIHSRQMRAYATELAALDAPATLSRDDRLRLQNAVTGRGGIHADVWTLVYGDG